MQRKKLVKDEVHNEKVLNKINKNRNLMVKYLKLEIK